MRAEELNVPVENLVSPDTIRQLCWQPLGLTSEKVSNQLLGLGARLWQVELIASAVAEALNLPLVGETQD